MFIPGWTEMDVLVYIWFYVCLLCLLIYLVSLARPTAYALVPGKFVVYLKDGRVAEEYKTELQFFNGDRAQFKNGTWVLGGCEYRIIRSGINEHAKALYIVLGGKVHVQ